MQADVVCEVVFGLGLTTIWRAEIGTIITNALFLITIVVIVTFMVVTHKGEEAIVTASGRQTRINTTRQI